MLAASHCSEWPVYCDNKKSTDFQSVVLSFSSSVPTSTQSRALSCPAPMPHHPRSLSWQVAKLGLDPVPSDFKGNVKSLLLAWHPRWCSGCLSSPFHLPKGPPVAFPISWIPLPGSFLQAARLTVQEAGPGGQTALAPQRALDFLHQQHPRGRGYPLRSLGLLFMM